MYRNVGPPIPPAGFLGYASRHVSRQGQIYTKPLINWLIRDQVPRLGMQPVRLVQSLQ